MKIKFLILVLLSSALIACGGSSSKSSSSSSSAISSSVSSSSIMSSESSVSISSSSSSEVSSSSAESSESSSSSSSTISCNNTEQPNFANVSPLSRSVLNGVPSEPEPPVTELPVYVCANNLFFCDDFASGSDQWNLLPIAGANGVFDILNDGGANNTLRYTAASSGAVGGILALVKPEAFAGVTSADYFVEARIRPRLNSSGTAQRSIYVMARYQDAENWYGMGMVAHETNQPRVEIVKKSGTGNPASTGAMRSNTAITLGTAGGTDGEWYTLRMTLIGSAMTLYLNGAQVATYTDSGLTERGLIGLFTSNRSFEIDDIKVGNANDVPAQLTLAPSNSSYAAEVNDEPRVITVTAKDSLGETGSFTVESSNTAIVSVTTDGNQVSLAPVGAGTAVITFTSGSDATLTRTITATIAPEFVQPTTVYELDCVAFPAPDTSDVHVDTHLHLTFDAPPTLGSVGAIRIFKASDDSLVDTIKLEYEKNIVGTSTASRELNTLPIQRVDNTVTIALHSDKLEYNTTYYVAISASVFPEAELAGQAFTGIGKQSGWIFTTKAAPPASETTSLTVGKSGATSDFASVQAALNFAMQNSAKATPFTINIQNGVYEEMLYLNNKDNVTIRGESRGGVIVQYRNSEKLNSGTDKRNLFLISNADMLTLDNFTIKNTTLIGDGGQAEAIYFNSQARMIAKNTNFISEQDTLLLKGYAWFYQSLVAGNVDFIWGSNRVALFEESEIRSLGRSSGIANGGYILQARTVNATDKGFVFLNSELTRGAGPTGEIFGDNIMWLARSGGSSAYYDNIAFINTKVDAHIRTAGWAPTPVANPAAASATSGWRQYNIMNMEGNPLDISGWILGYTLTEQEYQNEFSDRAKIFSEYNSGAGWNPVP